MSGRIGKAKKATPSKKNVMGDGYKGGNYIKVEGEDMFGSGGNLNVTDGMASMGMQGYDPVSGRTRGPQDQSFVYGNGGMSLGDEDDEEGRSGGMYHFG